LITGGPVILIAHSGDEYTFYIEPCGSGCRLTVEPANRHNGTQSFDGWFPRLYTRPQDAKAALPRFLGEAVMWEVATDE